MSALPACVMASRSSPTTSPALHDLGPDSVDLTRRTNDAVAEAVARHPTRFQAMATLPISMPDEAALELERCVSTLGFKGTRRCGRVGTRHLDDPAFAPVLEAAALLGVHDHAYVCEGRKRPKLTLSVEPEI